MKTQNKGKTEKAEKTEKIVKTDVVVPAMRGRTFEGTVTKKFATRVVVEFIRTLKVIKYERYYTRTTRIHARLPANLSVSVGDYVRVKETRPLSKIIHFIVTDKIKSAEDKK